MTASNSNPDAGAGRHDRSSGRVSRIPAVIGAVYLLLLIASHVVRRFQTDLDPRPGQRTVMLPEVDADRLRDALVGLSFYDSAPDSAHLPVVFLLHGSPVASSFMMEMHEALAEASDLRTITPDLPGFEGSSIDVADYSVRAHARYLLLLMDSLGVDEAHLIGYSMSGGVALHAADMHADRIASITMLSAIGVQELELTGDYTLNHLVHALQLASLWLVRESVPHFGWMDDAILSVPYARNFYDTDQRPLRGILRKYRRPMLIMHGQRDFLVPVQAAREHARLVPHSRLEILDNAGHGLPVRAPGESAARIAEFVRSVEAGTAATYEDADPGRIAAAAEEFDASTLPRATGFHLVVLIVLIAGATLVSEDIASIGAGLMAARGTFGIEHAMLASFSGILIGDIGLYLAGRILGRRIVRLPPFRWMIDATKLRRASSWFRRKGGRVIVVSRFIPGTRFPTYVAAGTLKAPFWRFLLYFIGAWLVWVPIITGGAMLVGNRLLEYYEFYEAYALWVLAGTILLVWLVIHTVLPLASHTGRRRFLSRWRRLRNWEFWPPWAFYSPVVLYILWLGIRHRSLTVFTAANPAIETGGFLGESKGRILSLFENASSSVAPFTVVERGGTGAESRSAQIADWMKASEIDFPVVLKPDVGERGDGVLIADSSADVRSYLETRPDRIVAQEYIPGPELGVFHVRRPGAERGEIFSVTEKHLVGVTGNGTDTLERLIWDDDRAMCSAPLFIKRHASDLDRVPAAGRRVRLVDVGTHCRGAYFTDGVDRIDEALLATFDRIASNVEGFHFGRFDIRVTDPARFPSGDSFRILEVNGVSSEATHIYDPEYSLLGAWKVLFRQWRLAFEIGAANARRGAPVTPLGRLLRLIWERKIRPPKPVDHADGARLSSSLS